METPFILGFDTGTTGCHVAVVRGADEWSLSETMERGQAERLVPMIGDALALAGIAPGDLAGIVTTIGPGSFTGVRVGVSTANTMAAVLNVPAAGIAMFDAFDIAHGTQDDASRLVVVETRRDDFFVRGPDDSAGCVMTAADTAARYGGLPRVLVGDGAARLAVMAGDTAWRVANGAERLSVAALARFAAGQPSLFGHAPLVPIYLRDAEISTPTRNRVIFPGASETGKMGGL